MTMSLARGLSTIRTSKPKQKKLTRSQYEKLAEELRLYNKRMKQAGRHAERMSFEEYVDYVHGKKKSSTKQEHMDPRQVKTYTPSQGYQRTTTQYKSLESSKGSTALPEKKEYTGTLIKGIATLHKSNAVPVLGKEDATEISQMRRN